MALFHILNRGVDKRNVFTEEFDYVRFLHDLYMFNHDGMVDPNHRFKQDLTAFVKRSPLVDILAFCLMPNHYHLLVQEIKVDGISKFMKKLNMGYAKYFNEKEKRSGYLWQGKYKKIHIKRDAHLLYIPYYIHLNPLDLFDPKWRSGNASQPGKAIAFLKKYRWSSFLDYHGHKNFPSILNMTFVADLLGPIKQQDTTIRTIITNEDLAQYANTLE